ncbi:MAG: hypothetical protein IPM69_06975 [Ignavibacteria bacterium]|nr:hypothetical protein [Ignavibacteria bacterium]
MTNIPWPIRSDFENEQEYIAAIDKWTEENHSDRPRLEDFKTYDGYKATAAEEDKTHSGEISSGDE